MRKELKFITKELVNQIVANIVLEDIPKKRREKDYAVAIQGVYYPYKYIITEAAKIAGVNITDQDFSSIEASRKQFTKITGYQTINLGDTISFHNLKELVQIINHDLGDFKFLFQNKKKQLFNKKRINSARKLFVFSEKHDDWAINEGGGTELQYHLYFRNTKVGFGLGFNTQYVPYKNDTSTTEYIRPFANSLLAQKTVQTELKQFGFNFIIGSEKDLINLKHDNYVLIGKQFDTIVKENTFSIPTSIYKGLLEDIKGILFQSYIKIVENRFNHLNFKPEMKKFTDLLKNKYQIILQGPPGTGKTRKAKDIAEQLIFNEVSADKTNQKKKLESSEQFKIIQFHPSYTYEDFVRGIVVETETGTPEYKTINKILGKFAKKANDSNLVNGVDDFKRAWEELVQDIIEGTVNKVGTSNVTVSINSQGNIKFNSPVATFETTYALYKNEETNLKYETYQKIVLNFLKDANGKYQLKPYKAPNEVQSNKPYVLIIDEINRANLPAVLGELIYALEYRGEKVESMYATLQEGNAILLPKNLYIIGTMNTADRSVAQIDYAIRRRFAFVEILPKVINDVNFDAELFKEVLSLFIKNVEQYIENNKAILIKSDFLSEEFQPKDVALGHSYFIMQSDTDNNMDIRLEYEIKPILLEYVKDGILKETARVKINDLSVS